MLLSALFSFASAAPATYTLDPGQSWLYVVVYYDRDRMTPVTAHDHVAKATTFTGKVSWDPETSACAIDISFPVTALRIDPPGAREREQLPADGAIEEDTKKTVVNNMLSKMNLHGDAFPTISYQASSCAARSDGRFDVTGDLTIRGVSKRITVPMEITGDGASFSASGGFELTHADFGMSPFTYGPLTPRNQERLKFVVDVVGKAP